MKTILFSILFTSLFSLPALAKKEITIQCSCSYEVDSIQYKGPVKGVHKNPTQAHIDKCVIEGENNMGKVVSGCGFAKMNAQYNCSEIASMESDDDTLQLSKGLLETNTCYAQIYSVED